MSTLAELTAALIAKEGRDYIAEFTAWANKVLTDLTDFQSSLMTAVQATSSTSLTLQVGEQTATIEAGKKFATGNRITIARNATQVMAANVVSYSGTTLVFNVLDSSDVTSSYTGTGPWSISLSGDEGLPGQEYWSAPTEITSAASPVAAGDKAVYLADTTAATITMNLQAGTTRVKVCDSAGVLNVNAVLVYPPTGESVMGGAVNEVYELDQAKAAYEIRRKANGNWRVYKL